MPIIEAFASFFPSLRLTLQAMNADKRRRRAERARLRDWTDRRLNQKGLLACSLAALPLYRAWQPQTLVQSTGNRRGNQPTGGERDKMCPSSSGGLRDRVGVFQSTWGHFFSFDRSTRNSPPSRCADKYGCSRCLGENTAHRVPTVGAYVEGQKQLPIRE